MNQLEKIISLRSEVVYANTLPPMDIIRHQNGLPPMTNSEIDEYIKIFDRLLLNATLDELAFTNVLWHSLSDFDEVFIDNFTFPTIKHIMYISKYLWKAINRGENSFLQPDTYLGPEKNKVPNPEYRAFMYFRDKDYVCHPLINYAGGRRWTITGLDIVLQESQYLKMKWILGQINAANWLD